MRPLSVSIVGLTSYDEMTLDLRELPPGLVAVTGDIGTGKSTLLECLGPVALTLDLPSKSKPLKDYCTRRDSRIELTFAYSGHEYRSLVQIDPQHGGGRGKSEAFLFVDGKPSDVYPTPNRVTDYKAAVAALLPDARVYMASAYSAQFGTTDFFALDVPARRDLFTTLLGNEADQVISTRAAEHRKQLDAILVDIERQGADLAATLARAETLDLQITNHSAATVGLQQAADLARESADVASTAAVKAHADYQAIESRRLQIEQQHRTLADQRSRSSQELARLEAGIDQDQRLVDASAQIREGLAALVQTRERRTQLAADYKAAGSALQTAQVQLSTAQDSLRKGTERGTADLQAVRRRSELIDRVPCQGQELVDPASGSAVDCADCELLADAVGARARLPELEAQVTAAGTEDQAAVVILQQACDLRSKTLAGIQTEGAGVRAVIDELAWADDRARQLDGAEARLPERQKAVKVERERLASIEQQMGELEPAPATEGLAAVQTLETQATAAKQQAQAAAQALERHRVEGGRLTGQREALGAVTDTVAELEARREAIALRRAGFRLVERGFGRDGLQALEIDAAGPSVSKIANDLLHSVYGSRFVLALQTVRPAEGARKAKEVFDVLIHDGDSPGRPRSLGDMSGGERTLVSEALRTAIALHNTQRHGIQVEALYRDEADGSLSPETAARYPRMLRKAMEIGGFRNVYLVTHRPDVAAQADAVIVVADGTATWRQQ